jgi:DNA topoisomerase-3
MNDALEVVFDFDNGDEDDSGEPVDFGDQQPLGKCPKCKARVFERSSVYVCEKAVGAEKTCDFRSGRTILQREIAREQMEKLLKNGKTDLLQFVSMRTKRPFSAYLVAQSDGKVGFEFEPRGEGASGRGARTTKPLRSLGAHPNDGAAVELYSGRYGPYVKHSGVNATVPAALNVEALTLEDALGLLAAKEDGGGGKRGAKVAKKTTAKKAAVKKVAAKKTAAKVAVKKTVAKKTTRKAKA